MQMRDAAGLFLIALALLAAATVINLLSLWSFLGNLTVPWICTSLAIAILIVGATCVLLRCAPSDVPARHAALIPAAVLLILGVGLIVDLLAYAVPEDWLASVGEWIGFAVILVGAFWLPRVGHTTPGT